MKLLFDARILTHKTYTGVENYANNILQNLTAELDVNIEKPRIHNKYYAHFWTHFLLPLKSGDIFFCPANIAPVFVPKNRRLVVTIHDVAFLTFPKSFSTFFRVYYKLIIPFVVNRADAIITVSEYSKREIERFYPKAKGKTKVIYLGYEDKFEVLDNVPKKDQILYVGSLNERKNFVGILKAFALLKRKDLRLLIVGNFSENFAIDEESKLMIDKAKQNPSIEFRNNVDNEELVRLYNESKLFVFPSFYEGFGLPVLEAMACGTPVICSGVASLPEVGGDAVMYCNPHSVEDIKEKIELVLGDEELHEQMIKKGLERAKMFSWKKSAIEHRRIFFKESEKV